MFRQGERLPNMGPVVLARRMDKESNSCTKERKANVGVLRGSGVVHERKEILWNMCESLARHKWCNQCRMSRKNIRVRRQSRFWRVVQQRARCRRNESLSLSIWLVVMISPVVCIRDERWSHDSSQSDVLYGSPQWGVQGISVRRCGYFGVEVHTL